MLRRSPSRGAKLTVMGSLGWLAGNMLRPIYELDAEIRPLADRWIIRWVGEIGWLVVGLAFPAMIYLLPDSTSSSTVHPLPDAVRGAVFLGFSFSLLVLTLRAVPKISDSNNKGLVTLGSCHYGLAGVVSGASLFIPTAGSFAVLAGLATIANAVAVNFCIQQWPGTDARKDIAKLLWRIPALMTVASLALMFEVGSSMGSIPAALTVLMVVFTGEVMFMVFKGKTTTATESVA